MPLYLEKLTAPQLDALPRDSTVIFFPVGALEDHGPHLPLGLDLDEAQALCRLAAERLEAERPGWKALVVPVAPLAVETHTSRFAFPVRGYVLRDYLVDTGWTFMREGFRHLVVFTGSPTPRQLVAIEEAGRILSRRSARRHGRLGHWFLRGMLGGIPSLVSAQSGGTRPGDLFARPFGADAKEHGGARDTSVALWLYQGSSREPRELPAAVARDSDLTARLWKHYRNRSAGYWGDPSKASAFRGESAVLGVLDDATPRLRAWLDGASPGSLFHSWYSVLPSNRTTFRAWILLLAIAALFALYVWIGVPDA